MGKSLDQKQKDQSFTETEARSKYQSQAKSETVQEKAAETNLAVSV